MDQFPLKTTRPPFLATNSLRLWTSANAELPTAFQCGDELRNPTTDILAFLAWDLQTPRLDGLHDYLWLAGLMQPARELHRQRLLGRTICITERPEEHLVWHENTIFIKPLPEYLLGHAFWAASICPHEPLYRSALGLLWSYTWLVRSKSDLKIAHDLGLLPTSLDWAAWAGFSRDVLDRDQQQVWQEVDPRYAYGELRLTRLNTLYHLGFAGLSPQNLVWAYMTGSQRYTTFFQRNFGWLLAVFVLEFDAVRFVDTASVNLEML
ncbi:uncharacterized protein B0I36DRAFT_378338 [Microdochium trichocladiopsis]|uniref:Uncharacterized protein n=1 Tax=Microdochium trichocladiopsis TaxID=1682393 RepID=A0A9P9BI15_9PEZI|nr:uncharacterized protein B0I36DRAFT_378338 [Microdochium trichocladiopsis]KAH7012607.1 hypothetical protein B0I36DRAFT_378338 [Microdochium trichocladiopsis]